MTTFITYPFPSGSSIKVVKLRWARLVACACEIRWAVLSEF
jgi:hypothetical protein